ncbi:MAG: DUF6364 family protein [Cyclobacteriaceae bacterium]
MTIKKRIRKENQKKVSSNGIQRKCAFLEKIRTFTKTRIIMKTKLTLTVKKSVIEAAKRKAKNQGISLSQMFEEIFESMGSNQIKTAPQRAAEMLINRLEKYDSINELEDKKLIKEHVKRKFA